MASGNPLRKIIDWFNAQDVVDDPGEADPPPSQPSHEATLQKKQQRPVLTLRSTAEGGMEIRHPRNIDDRMAIGMDLKLRRLVTLDLTHFSDAEARVFLEFIYGVVFALDATAEKVTDGIYLLAPNGVVVRNDTDDQPEPARSPRTATRAAAGNHDVQEELFWQGS